MFRARFTVIELTFLWVVFESVQTIAPVPHSKSSGQGDWEDLESLHSHQGNPENYLIVHPKVSQEIIFEQPILLIQMDKWLLIFPNSDNLHFASNFKAEWIKANSTSNWDATKCSFKTGYIQGLERWSRAAVSICNTLLTGYFEMRNDSYFFEPFNGAHKLLKSQKKNNFPARPVRAAHTDWLFNLTGDTIDIEGNDSSDVDVNFDRSINESNDSRFENVDTEIPLEYLRKGASGSYDEENGYFYDTAWSAVITEAYSSGGKTLPTRWLEIAVGVDHSLISFHGKDKVQQYVLALMNIVSAIYQDASLGANIKLVIARLLFYEHSKHGVVRPGNAKKSLENVNIWNRKLHAQLKPGQPRHDVAIWLTRSDIGGPSGYAPVGGVCDPKRSCALNKDEGLTSAFIIAHEMAHMLGLSHDGDKKTRNDCGQDAAEGSVMAAMVSATFSKFSWSKCSKREYKQKVGNWTCLFNAPRSKGEIQLNATLQTVFSMDEQCRMEFGDGYLMCRAFDIIEPCSHLWCGHKDSPLVCKTKKGPPLEGTECGFAKWCLNGYCSEIPQRPNQVPVLLNPQHGGWSEWSLWGPCSRSCGVGVQYRYRNCDNPKPSFGGKDCEGSNEDYRLCNKATCENQFVDLRAQQCEMLPRILNATFTSTSDTWLPYESLEEESKCKFSCMSDERKEILTLEENLPDGTPCSYEDEDKICIQGKCLLIGCDGQLSSTLVRDRCGTCGGDGSGCNTTTITLRRKMKKEVKKITVFPRMARHIQLEANVSFQDKSQKETPSIAFVLKNRKKRGYAVAIPNTVPNSKVVEGAHFFYRKDGGVHRIWAIGPVLAELLIMIISSAKQALKGIKVSANSQYSIHKSYMVPSTKFIWIIGGWGPCSRSCGGGKRQKTAACWDNLNAKLVKRKFCSLLEKPALETESCNNFGCEFQWVAGVWEPCSATCGSLGMQSREVYCVPSAKSQSEQLEEIWRHMVSPRRCLSSPPATSKPCNRIPCLYFWQYSQWSECSASCGTGISSRTAYCPALDDGTCGEPPPPQRQICAGNFTRTNNPLCKGRKLRECKQDESKYCAFNLLQRYCQLKGFRRLCCRSCAGFMEKNVKKHSFLIGSV